jgi:hypothetical protein
MSMLSLPSVALAKRSAEAIKFLRLGEATAAKGPSKAANLNCKVGGKKEGQHATEAVGGYRPQSNVLPFQHLI